MKTIRKFGMALLAVLVCVNFTSCSTDDDGGSPSNQSGKEKKLIELKKYDASREELKMMYDFKYNQTGKVSEFTESYIDNREWVKETINISWDSNKSITLTSEEDEPSVATLSNGKISQWESCNFTYNEDGFLKRIEDEDGYSIYTQLYTWNNDYLYSIDYQEEYGQTTNKWTESIRYGNKTCKGFLPIWGENVGISEFGLFIAMPELVGVKTVNLPTEISGKFSTTFEYKFDADGYVTRCTVKEHGVEEEQTIYEFVWE